MQLSVSALVEFYSACLRDLGVEETWASRISRAQVEVEAFGVSTHGLNVLHYIIDSLLAGRMDPEKTPGELRQFGAAAVYDGSGTIPVRSLLEVRDEVCRKARQFGIGLVSTGPLGWLGALGYHLAAPAREGFLMMGWAQLSGDQTVVPFGGREPRLSTNPIAFAIPASPHPVVADFATSAFSNGKVFQAKAAGKKLPEPLLVDASGRPSDDPSIFRQGGNIMPFGGWNSGFRGTALALWIEALTAAMGCRPANADREGGQHLHLMAIHAEAMGDQETCLRLTTEMLDYIRSSEPAEGFSVVRLPGDAGWKKMEAAKTEGIHLSEEQSRRLNEYRAKFSLTWDDAISGSDV